MKITLYSNHCPKCRMIEAMLSDNRLPFTLIDDEDTYLAAADNHGIVSMPFAEIDGQFMACKEIQDYIKNLR